MMQTVQELDFLIQCPNFPLLSALIRSNLIDGYLFDCNLAAACLIDTLVYVTEAPVPNHLA